MLPVRVSRVFGHLLLALDCQAGMARLHRGVFAVSCMQLEPVFTSI
jgi:hypothetical protein